jgi:hypothetical protein
MMMPFFMKYEVDVFSEKRFKNEGPPARKHVLGLHPGKHSGLAAEG